MSVNPAEMDIHNIRGRFENAIRNLQDHNRICPENKQKTLEFLEHCLVQDLSVARRPFLPSALNHHRGDSLPETIH